MAEVNWSYRTASLGLVAACKPVILFEFILRPEPNIYTPNGVDNSIPCTLSYIILLTASYIIVVGASLLIYEISLAD